MSSVVIVSAVRTPIGSLCGAFMKLESHDLGSIAIQDAVQRASVEPSEISQVIMGQALLGGQGANPARQAAVKAGIPYSVPAYSVNMLCGSGLKTVSLGYQAIKCGDAEIIVCGGQESMSRAVHVINLRTPVKLGNSSMKDSLLLDALEDPFFKIHMGITAENIAEQTKISRADQDLYALESQSRVEHSQQNNFFNDEIVAVKVGEKLITKDEHPRSGLKLADLERLKPVFAKTETGTVTAGNASGINDGAAALVMMTETLALQKGIKPLVKIIGTAEIGLNPQVMGLGPVDAITALLKKVNWKVEEVDFFEINEAFAAQALAVIRVLKLDASKVNICGGSISLGHPLGASGTRILVTLIHILLRTGGTRGIAALCIGGGMGIAMAVERYADTA